LFVKDVSSYTPCCDVHFSTSLHVFSHPTLLFLNPNKINIDGLNLDILHAAFVSNMTEVEAILCLSTSFIRDS